jgi:hypothetical protein
MAHFCSGSGEVDAEERVVVRQRPQRDRMAIGVTARQLAAAISGIPGAQLATPTTISRGRRRWPVSGGATRQRITAFPYLRGTWLGCLAALGGRRDCPRSHICIGAVQPTHNFAIVLA